MLPWKLRKRRFPINAGRLLPTPIDELFDKLNILPNALLLSFGTNNVMRRLLLGLSGYGFGLLLRQA